MPVRWDIAVRSVFDLQGIRHCVVFDIVRVEQKRE